MRKLTKSSLNLIIFNSTFSIFYGFLFILVIAVDVDSQSHGNLQQVDASNECFISYLKQQSISDEYFNSARSYNGISPACQRGVESEKLNLLRQAQFSLRYKNNFECMQAAVQTDEMFKNLLLNVRVLKSTREIMKKINSALRGQKSPKEIAIERVEKQLRDVLLEIEVKCAFSFDFSNLFDSFFERNHDEFIPYEEIQEYCIKKELSENEVINLNEFKIALNPKHLRVENFDCSKLIQPLKTEIIESLKDFESDNHDKSQKQCIFSELNEGNDYFHTLLKAELISKLNLSSNEVQQEKKTFVDKMTDISLKVREKC